MNETKTSQTPTVSKLDALVQYNSGTVSSRALFKSPGATVTLFAFDQGEGLSEHTAPFDAMVYVLEGEVDIEIAGAPYRLKTGETVTMPAHAPHALKALTRFKMLLIMVKA